MNSASRRTVERAGHGGRRTRNIVGFLLACLVISPHALGQYTDQPAGHKSYLLDKTNTGAGSISDADLTTWLEGALEANYNSAVLVFGECYGGGMLDDIDASAVLTGKPLYACSASKHDEESVNLHNGKHKQGVSTFLFAFTPQLAAGNQVGTAFTNAKNVDAGGPNGSGHETPESHSDTNGDKIVVGTGADGDAASSFHAVLFVGYPNKCAHWTELVRVYQMLRGKNYPAANIAVFFGAGTDKLFKFCPTGAEGTATNCQGVPAGVRPMFPGEANPNGEAVAQEATKAKLQTAIAGLENTFSPDSNDEQFFFFAFDHGARTTSRSELPEGDLPDPCEGVELVDPDCDSDGMTDDCEISSGLADDVDGDGTPDECESPVPTVSEWGLTVMTVLGLTVGTILFGRRRRLARS